jgi:hypothetical protein
MRCCQEDARRSRRCSTREELRSALHIRRADRVGNELQWPKRRCIRWTPRALPRSRAHLCVEERGLCERMPMFSCVRSVGGSERLIQLYRSTQLHTTFLTRPASSHFAKTSASAAPAAGTRGTELKSGGKMRGFARSMCSFHLPEHLKSNFLTTPTLGSRPMIIGRPLYRYPIAVVPPPKGVKPLFDVCGRPQI